MWGISSAGRALAWHARGHQFKSGILHFLFSLLRYFARLLVRLRLRYSAGDTVI